MYVRDYTTTVDGLNAHLTRQRAAAFSGKYDPALKALWKSEEARDIAHEAKESLGELREKAKELADFPKYLRELMRCADGSDKDWNGCVKRVNELHEKVLGDLPLDGATQARVKAAGDAYQKYVGHALERAMAAANTASRCSAECR